MSHGLPPSWEAQTEYSSPYSSVIWPLAPSFLPPNTAKGTCVSSLDLNLRLPHPQPQTLQTHLTLPNGLDRAKVGTPQADRRARRGGWSAGTVTRNRALTHLPEAPLPQHSVLPEGVFGYRLPGKKARIMVVRCITHMQQTAAAFGLGGARHSSMPGDPQE